MATLVWLESTALATWIRESSSLLAYPGVISLHAVGLAVMVGLSTMIDFRLLGFAPGLPLAGMQSLYRWIWIGFWVNAVSGVGLLIASATTMLVNPLFYTKMGLIALSMITVVLINRAAFAPGNTSSGVTRRARTLAITSLVLWAATIVTGRLTAYLGNN